MTGINRRLSAPFPADVYQARNARARAGLRAAGFDALLLFAQESLYIAVRWYYYLTGFDYGGYVFFQCALLTVDESPITLLTRRPDRDQAGATSITPDIRIWLNAEDADPAGDVRDTLTERGLAAARLGLELNTYGLTGYNHELLRRALDGFCELADGSSVVRDLRLIKGPEEVGLIRQAAALGDKAVAAMTAEARPGRALGAIDEAHRRVFDAAGYREQRLAACGYALGATYRPSWMDVPLMLYAGNPLPAVPGMRLFLHVIIGDAESGLAVGLGHSLLVTEAGPEVLNKVSLAIHQR